MHRSLLLHASWFALGAVVTAAPFLIAGELQHRAEAAVEQETMGPGIIMFDGLIAAPFGGLGALVIAACVRLWSGRTKGPASGRGTA